MKKKIKFYETCQEKCHSFVIPIEAEIGQEDYHFKQNTMWVINIFMFC